MRRSPESLISFPVEKKKDNRVVFEAIDSLQKLDELLVAEKPAVDVRVNTNNPYRIVHLSDLHFGHLRVNYRIIDEQIKDILNDKNSLVIFYGDLVEGIKADYLSTNVIQTVGSFDKQILGFKNAYLQPLAEKGKIAAMVGMYKGHEGWAFERSTIDAVRLLADGLKAPDGNPVPIVQNGGLVNLIHPNGEKLVVRAFHNPGGGGSRMNPVGAQRRASWESKLDTEGSPDITAGGHFHERSAFSQEITRRADTGVEVSNINIATGTTKGVEDAMPDEFTLAAGHGTCRPGGVATVVVQKKDDLKIYPAFGMDRSRLLLEAMDVWNKAEQGSLSEEITQMILERFPKPQARFQESLSRVQEMTDNVRYASPLYELLRWQISSEMPVIIYTFGNARYGSSSFNREKFHNLIREIEKNPYAYGLALRHMVNSGVSKTEDREEVLANMARDLSRMADKNKLLGFMLSGSLREDSWGKEVKKRVETVGENGKNIKKNVVVSDSFAVSDYLYFNSDIKGVPVYKNMARFEFDVSGAFYRWMVLDHLKHSGSVLDPFRGLVRAENSGRLSYDCIVGGHMPHAGVLTTEDTDYIAPGWFSNFDSQGKSNEETPPQGGQAVILYPKERRKYACATREIAQDMHAALFMQAGLKRLGKLRSVMTKTA